jgi:uncharacterized protein
MMAASTFTSVYIGPLGGQGNNKRVKVDISRSEQLVFEPVKKDVFVDYTDLEEYQLLCYPLEEVLVEKMRSVMQRMQARDFYDIWYLIEKCGMDAEFYMNEFETKCKSKDLKHTDFPQKLTERLPQYKGRWQSSMSQQIKDLPDFDQIEREVKKTFQKNEIMIHKPFSRLHCRLFRIDKRQKPCP